LTENARTENDGPSRMASQYIDGPSKYRGVKMQDTKMQDPKMGPPENRRRSQGTAEDTDAIAKKLVG